MSLDVHWKPASGGLAYSIAIAPGQPFALGTPTSPDVFAFYSGKDGLSLVVSNGLVDPANPSKSRGPLTGSVLVSYGGETRLPLTPVVLHDGCGKVFRFGTAKAPTLAAPVAWSSWWLRHNTEAAAVKLAEALSGADFTIDESGAQNTEQSGSQRVAQSIHRLTLAVLLGIRADEARDAAIAYNDFQIEHRHAVFYFADGKPVTAAEPWFRQGPLGLVGSAKRPCGTKWQFEGPQHPAPDVSHLLAAGFNDGPAKLYADAHTECFLSYPEFQGALADDPRSHGYCLRHAAIDLLRRPGYQPVRDGLVRCVSGLRNAMGYALGGVPYPCRNPAKTGKWPYGWASTDAWTRYAKLNALTLPADLKPPTPGETCDHLRPWLVAQAKTRNLPPTRYTDGPGGLWDYFRGVPIFQCAVLLQGLCTVRDVPEAAALVPDIDDLIWHVTKCILIPGTLGGVAPDGSAVKADPVVYAYSALAPWYVMPWTTGNGQPVTGRMKNGAVTWLCNSLLLSGVMGASKMAADIWKFNDYPSPHDPEVFGVLGYREFA